MATFLAAEVVNNLISFKETESKKTQSPFPQGAIKFKLFNVRRKARTVEIAMPLDPYITEIPLVGEYVLIIQLLDKNADPYFQKHQYYYTQILNIWDRVNENKMPGIQSSSPPIVPTNEAGMKKKKANTIDDNTDISRLQSYEGDKLIYSRFGSSIRFSSNNIKDQEKITYENKNTPWDGGDVLSPILMLTNGYKQIGAKLTIEDPKTDKSLIYLTSDQKIDIDSSQTKLGSAINNGSIKTYSDSQVIISSDRLLFNARKDNIILSANEDVNIATPTWAMEMNKFFDLFDEFLEEILKTARAESNYLTGVGPTTGNPTLLAAATIIQTKLKLMKQ
tara:strand:+ start:15305 stop:16309 length:1005 start_codon:yes stop_codon:yes gene_type:complete